MQFSSLRPGHLFGVASFGALALGTALAFWGPAWTAQARESAAPTTAPKTSNVAMNCAPNQQARVRQQVVNGELSVTVECGSSPAVNGAGFDQSAPAVENVRPVSAVYAATPVPLQTYRAPRTFRAARPATTRRVAPRHDWRKDVLIVGGSAGAGAGIGGLVGGKKGALIGAALGGGGAALFRVAQK